MILMVLKRTLDVLNENKRSFLRIAYIPIVLFLVIEINWLKGYELGFYVFMVIIYNLVYVIFAVGIHRLIILGPKSNKLLGNLRFKYRELRYIGYLLLISIICIPISLLGFIPYPYVGEYLALIGYIYVFARYCLILPAVAVEDRFSFKEAKEISGIYHWEIFVLLGIFPFLSILPLYLLGNDLTSQIITSIYSTVITIFNVGIISVTYEILTGSREPEDVNIEV